MRDFTRTKAALQKYDAADAAFEIQSQQLSTSKLLPVFDELQRLGREVGRCFFEETSDINGPSCITVVRPSPWLRKTIGLPYSNSLDGRVV